MNNFFANQPTPEIDQVSLAAFQLLEEAQLWYYKLKQEESDINWDKITKYCLLRFGPPVQR